MQLMRYHGVLLGLGMPKQYTPCQCSGSINLIDGSSRTDLKYLITVCANHHRRLHYGNAKRRDNPDGEFLFEVDGVEVRVPKVVTLALPSANTKGLE
jgi:hypothetical protein